MKNTKESKIENSIEMIRHKDSCSELVGFKIPSEITWSFDYSLFLFIRDSLNEFLKHNDGVPQEYIDAYKEENKSEEDIENIAFYHFNLDVKDLADKFDWLAENLYSTEREESQFQSIYEEAMEKLTKILPYINW